MGSLEGRVNEYMEDMNERVNERINTCMSKMEAKIDVYIKNNDDRKAESTPTKSDEK